MKQATVILKFGNKITFSYDTANELLNEVLKLIKDGHEVEKVEA